MYRQLNEQELKHLYNCLHAKFTSQEPTKYKRVVETAKKYYNGGALALVCVRSEYNDNTYDNEPGYVLIFDNEGNELLPKKGEEIKARKELQVAVYGLFESETNEPLEDVKIPLNLVIPALFVKE